MKYQKADKPRLNARIPVSGPLTLVLVCARRAMAYARPFGAFQTAANEREAAPLALTTQIGASNESTDLDQDWIRVSPYGAYPNEVGLQVFDRAGADSMVEAFNSVSGRLQRLFRGLPVYVGHPDEPKWIQRNPGATADAVGRVKRLEARTDGLYAQIAWNDKGKELISGEAAPYAFHSPRWGMVPIVHDGRKAFRPVQLFSLGLTNNPNIPDNVVGLNETNAISDPMKSNLIKLLAALGKTVAADATEDQLTAALNEALPIAQNAITAVNEIAGLRTQLGTSQAEATTAKTQLAEQKAIASNERAARADTVLVTAINSGRITEAQRTEWKNKLVAASDFTVAAKELSELKPAVNTQSAVAGLGNRRAEADASNSTITAINEAVHKYCKDHGMDPQKEHHTAYCAVKAANPALFVTQS